jgi:hypothetical protein
MFNIVWLTIGLMLFIFVITALIKELLRKEV